jgi:adenylylsulfate kinase-like enzyme
MTRISRGTSDSSLSSTLRVLLLHGMAGTGKSTIANTIASRYNQLKRLGGSFCFKRGDEERSPLKMFSTIARGMADLDDAYRIKLYEAIKLDTRLRTSGMWLQRA